MRLPRLKAVPFFFVGVFMFRGDTPLWFALPVAGLVGFGVWWWWSSGRESPDALPEGEDLQQQLIALGRGELARELARGLGELDALRAWRATVGDVDVEEAAARAEAASLRARADGAADADTAETWREAASLADRRVERLGTLRGEWERVSARIAAFEQAMKTLRVDLAAVPKVPGALDSHLAGLGREVQALARAHAEVLRLEGR